MINQAEFTESLRAIVLRKIEQGEAALPVLPESATRLEHLLADPNVEAAALAPAIERDLVLSAQVMREARGLKLAESVGEALEALGAKRARTWATATVERQIFTSRVLRVDETLHRLWQHSLTVGLFARDLAGLVGCADPEAAYLAGLLHDVGQAVVAIYLLEFERSLVGKRNVARDEWLDHDAWWAIVSALGRAVGVALVDKWRLPEAVRRAVGRGDDFDAGDRRSVENVVHFSDALAKQIGIHAGPIDENQVALILMLGRSILEVDEDVIARLSELATGQRSVRLP
jgi:putative nucleotidyltransferase with HDIG domain